MSPRRVVQVAVGLMAAGGVAGAVAGMLGAALFVVLLDGPRALLSRDIYLAGAFFGAPLGALLLPLAGFTALRRVPLGRLLATTTLATALGGAGVGILVPDTGWLAGALGGFLIATGWLWYRSSRRPPA